MSLSRREFVRSVGWSGTGMLTLPFIISRGREELSARGIEGQNPPLIEPGFIRISGNENPRGPGDAALRALEGRVSYKVGRYPDNPPGLAETIAALYGAKSENVLMSTGSAGLLAAAVRAFTSPGRPLVKVWLGQCHYQIRLHRNITE
jgi:histidinol-phosphate/aromatic aminotransferase/cobyric acid decarboxylase-like protein